MEPSSSLTLTNPAHGSSRATNENTAIFYIPPIQPQHFCVENTKAITLTPQPLKLDIYTATDWPAVSATFFVGITGAMVALAVGGIAYLGSEAKSVQQLQTSDTIGKKN